MTTQCGSYVSPQLTCSPLSSQQLSFVRLVYGRSWVHFPSGTQNFLGVLLSTHIILIINKPWIQTNTFSIIRFSLRQNFGQPKIRPVETLQNTYFFHSLWQKCLPLQIKRPFPLPHCNVVCSNTTNAHVSCSAKTTLHKGWGGGSLCSILTKRLHGAKLKNTWQSLNICPGLTEMANC